MSNVVGATATIAFAFLWLAFDTLSGIAYEYARAGFTHFVSSLESTVHSTVDCNVISIDGVVVLQSERQTLQHITRVFESRVRVFESHEWSISVLLYVLDHIYHCLAFSAVLVGLCFVCVCQCNHGRRRPATRPPNPRPVLCRGGGTLS